MQRKLIRHTGLRKRVVERIKDVWTPEQIAYRMIHEKSPLKVCQEAIYCYIYSRKCVSASNFDPPDVLSDRSLPGSERRGS
jgi:hypothetical protein